MDTLFWLSRRKPETTIAFGEKDQFNTLILCVDYNLSRSDCSFCPNRACPVEAGGEVGSFGQNLNAGKCESILLQSAPVCVRLRQMKKYPVNPVYIKNMRTNPFLSAYRCPRFDLSIHSGQPHTVSFDGGQKHSV